jgi:adenylate cyclase
MPGLWGNKNESTAVSAEFQHALMRQVMCTELIRVRALIGTTAILAVLLLIIHTVDPYAV